MSAPRDDAPPAEADAPSKPAVAKRLAPSEMFPAQEGEAPPDVFDIDVRRSHRSHKEQVDAFAGLAKDLIGLAPRQLETLDFDLDPELRAAIAGCAELRKGARIREQRRIATALRRVDARGLRDRLDEIARGDRAQIDRDKELERWRERLLEGGDAELSKFVQAYPNADRQQLRQLIRTAGPPRTKGRAVAAYRKLLREIRDLDEA